MASRNVFADINFDDDRVSVNDLVGPSLEIDTRRPLQRIDPGQGSFITAGLDALQQTIGIGAKVQAVKSLRADRAKQKFDMRQLEMEHEKDQQVLDCVSSSFDVNQQTGKRDVLNRRKLQN